MIKNKPVIINIRENLHKGSMRVPVSPRSTFPCGKEFLTKLDSMELRNKKKNVSMVTELDAELKNDFKWLINFNLKPLIKYDIDEELHDNKKMSFQKRRFRSTENVSDEGSITEGGNLRKVRRMNLRDPKEIHSSNYEEIVELCLKEKGETSMKYIYKWISERFPCFKPEDNVWKKNIRQMMTKCNKFKKKKFRAGKYNSWCLDKQCTDYSETRKSSHKQSQCSVKSNQYVSELCDEIADIEDNLISIKYFPVKNFPEAAKGISEVDDYQEITVAHYPSENWIETRDNQVEELINDKTEHSLEYYEMQTPLATEFLSESTKYTEPLEVICFMGEDVSSIPLGLL